MKQSKLLSIFGASGHGKIVLAAAKSVGYNVTAFYDDNTTILNTEIHNIPVRGPIKDFNYNSAEHAIIAIGNNQLRKKFANQFQDVKWITIIHPRSYVDTTAKVGAGSLICAGAIVQIDTVLGMHTIINSKASVEHDCTIGDFVHIAPGVNLAGNVSVDDGAMIGIGASVIPGVNIGKNSIVGAGSVVIKDVPDNAVVAGCPATVIKKQRCYIYEK